MRSRSARAASCWAPTRAWSRSRPRTGSAVEMVATFGFTDEELAGWRRFPLSQRTPIGEAIESGKPVFLDEGEREKRFPDSGGRGAPTASVPLRVGRRTLGALGFRFERGHVFDDSERDFARHARRAVRPCARARPRVRRGAARRSALGLLAAIGEQLARSLDPDAALRTLADLVVPQLADQCVVDSSRARASAGSWSSTPIPRCRRPLASWSDTPRCWPVETPVAVAIRTSLPQLVPLADELPDIGVPQPEAPRRRADGRHPHHARRTDGRARTDARRAHVRVAEPNAPGSRPVAARRADRTPRRARAREQLALPGGARRARTARRADAPAAARRDHRRDLVAQAAVREPACAGPARAPARRSARSPAPTPSSSTALWPASRPPTARSTSFAADGSHGIVSLSAEPVRAPDGEIVAAVATLFDITEHRQREQALAFLAEASVVLTETLDLQHTLTELVELAVPRLADWCTIDMLDHGEIRTIGVAHADPDTARLARRLHARRPVRKQASSGVSAALSTGRSQLIQDVPAWLAEQETPDEELVTMSRILGVRSSIVAPLAGHGRVFGALTLATTAIPGGASRSRTWRSRRISGAAPRWRSRTRGSTAPSTTSRTPCSRACCPARSRSRPAPRSSRATARRARAPRSEATSTTPGRPATHYFLAIGDVAGHGPAAAALTSLTRQAMRVVSRYEQSPGRILAVVNDTIRAQSAPEQFCTAALAALRQTDDGYEVTVACAGHPPPVVVRASGRASRRSASAGALLGVLPQREYDDRKCRGRARRPRRVLDRRRDRAAPPRRHVRRGAPALAARRPRQPRCERRGARDRRGGHELRAGLPDDDVAILIARVTGAPVEREGAGGPPPGTRSCAARRIACAA